MYAWLLLGYMCHMTCAGDVKPQREHYTPDYTVYHNVSRVVSHLQQIAAQFPQYIHLDLSYQSRLGRAQPVLRITNYTRARLEGPFHDASSARAKILLSYGEHAREFLPVESMFALVENVTGGLRAGAAAGQIAYSSYVVNNVDLFIVAMINPDGRAHIENSGNYCWRGTSTGVDLNRNFDWNFGGAHGSSRDPQDEEYRGPRAFSEPETRVLLELTAAHQFDAFLSLHSGIRQIYVPFADSTSRAHSAKPDNAEGMLALATRMAAAAHQPFTYGLAYTLNDYTADGTIFDYMAGDRKIAFSLAVELWGSDNAAHARCFDLFNPRSSRLMAAVSESLPMYDALIQHVVAHKRGLHAPHGATTTASRQLSLTHWLLLLLLLLCLILTAYHYRPRAPLTLLPCTHRSCSMPCARAYRRPRRVVSLRSLSSAFSVSTYFKVS